MKISSGIRQSKSMFLSDCNERIRPQTNVVFPASAKKKGARSQGSDPHLFLVRVDQFD
jgi:hypothetical protein